MVYLWLRLDQPNTPTLPHTHAHTHTSHKQPLLDPNLYNWCNTMFTICPHLGPSYDTSGVVNDFKWFCPMGPTPSRQVTQPFSHYISVFLIHQRMSNGFHRVWQQWSPHWLSKDPQVLIWKFTVVHWVQYAYIKHRQSRCVTNPSERWFAVWDCDYLFTIVPRVPVIEPVVT